MEKLLKRAGGAVAACILGFASPAAGQLAPPGPPVTESPLPPAAPNSLPSAGYVSGPLPGATPAPGALFPIQAQPAAKETGSGQSPAGQTPAGQTPSDPLLSSKPPAFQAGAAAPAAANDYAGNKSVQDLSSLVTGNFKDTKYKWYGFVRLDGIYDFRPIGSTDSFVTSAIPVSQGRGQNAVLTPRYTRFGFDTETPIKELDWTLKTRIEVDFFNGNTSGAFGSFPLRMRFAWADFGPFLIGQAASLFMDYDVFPNVLDYQGPPGMVLMRQPVFAVHFPVGEKVKVSVGVEQPYSDIQWLENGAWVVNPGSGIITTPGVGRNVQDVPDLTANVKYTGDYGHVQLAGIMRKLTFQPGVGDGAFDTTGYGFNLTGSYHPWAALSCTPTTGDCATPLSKSRFLGQFAAGRGISRYYNDVNGLGLDATYDPANGLRAIPSSGWVVSYEHWWAKKFASVFSFSQDSLELTDSLPGSTYQRADYVSANLIWLPVERMGFGLEYLYGLRKNKDGQQGDNTRLQMAFQYRF